MEKTNVYNHTIAISSPSQLVLNVDEFFRLSKKLPSQSETLQRREQQIFDSLGKRSISPYERIVMFKIDLEKVADSVNAKYQDGIYLEDDFDTIRYPYDRTIRTKPIPIEDPSTIKDLSTSKITSIKVGKHRLLQDNTVSIKRFTTPLLGLSDTFESGSRHR